MGFRQHPSPALLAMKASLVPASFLAVFPRYTLTNRTCPAGVLWRHCYYPAAIPRLLVFKLPPELKPALIQNSLDMYSLDRRQLKLCLIDEAWQLLQGESSGDFIENGYRRARKYRGSFGTGTQGLGDYDKSVAARAALDNSDWMFLLAQRPESVAAMIKQEKLAIDEEMEKILRSINTQQGVYAEVYVRAGDSGAGVGRILLDPYTLLMFSSKGEDVAAIQAYQDNGYPIHDALEAVLADRGVEGFVHPDQRQLTDAQATDGYFWEEEEEQYV